MIPKCWSNENENYITVPVMREFCKQNQIKGKMYRNEILKEIENFDEKSEENHHIVEQWIETVLKEGMKHIYIKMIHSNNMLQELLNTKNCIDKLQEEFPENKNASLYHYRTQEDAPTLQHYKIKEKNQVTEKITFVYIVPLYEEKCMDRIERIMYPVFVDINLKNRILVGRAKSKANLYFVNELDKKIKGKATSTEKVIIQIIEKIIKHLKLELESDKMYEEKIKENIYTILEKYTFTPQVIQEKIEKLEDFTNDFKEQLIKELEIPKVSNQDKIKEDLKILIEKYISINIENKRIFTQDREAYPYKLISTDSEFTRVEETSREEEPLQCKEKFFDNKKSVQSEKACDGICLVYTRKNNEFFSGQYKVKIQVKRHYCCIQFSSYVQEEDIQNVLSNIIGIN